MILLIICISLFIIGLVCLLLAFQKSPAGEVLGSAIVVIDGIVLFGSIILIMCAHIGVNDQIAKANIKYNGLSKMAEIINSDYEDVSKITAMEKITEWNQGVASEKYWAENKWTNWFYSKEYADSLKYVEIKEVEND